MAVDAGGRTGGVRRGLGGRLAHRMWRRRRAQEQARLRQLAPITNEQPMPDSTTSNDQTEPNETGHRNNTDNNKNQKVRQNQNNSINSQCENGNDQKMVEIQTGQQESTGLNCGDVSISDDSSIESDDSSEESSDSDDESEDFSSTDESDEDGQKDIKTEGQNNDNIVELPVDDNVNNDDNNEHAEENQGTSNEQGQGTSNEKGQGTCNEQVQGTSNEQGQDTANELGQRTFNEQVLGTSNEQDREISNEQGQGTSNEQVQGTSNEQGQETSTEQAQVEEPERNSDNFVPFAEILRLHQLALIQKQFKTEVLEIPENKTANIIQRKSDDFPEWSEFLAMHEAKQKREYEEDHPEAAMAMSPISSEENKWICEEWAKMWAKCERLENQQRVDEIEEKNAEETSQKGDDECQEREERNEENPDQDLGDRQLNSDEEEYEAESIVEYDDFQAMLMSSVDEINISQENEVNMNRYEAMQVEIERKWLEAQKVKEVEERFKSERAERERSRYEVGCGRRQRTRQETDRMRREYARRESDCLKRERERERIRLESDRSRRERSRLEAQCTGIVCLRNKSDRIRRDRVRCEIERVKQEWALYESECIFLKHVRHNSEHHECELEQLEAKCLMHERVNHEVGLVKQLRLQTEKIKHELAQYEAEQIERDWAREEAEHIKREKIRSQAERVLCERAQHQTKRVRRERMRHQGEGDGRERAQRKVQNPGRKRGRHVLKRAERSRLRHETSCVKAEREPGKLGVEHDQVQRGTHWIQALALIPIYQQNFQVAQRNWLADLVPCFGAHSSQQIGLSGALSDYMLELGTRRENAVYTFSQREPVRQIQLAILGGINQPDVLQMYLWEEFLGVRLNQELLLAPETRWEQMLDFRAQRELFVTPGERREQVLSIFVRRIQQVGTPARRAHTSRIIARLQRILHMREVLFHRCINQTEMYFPVINIREENILKGFDFTGPLQDLEQYPIYDNVQRPQIPIQLELHVRIQYPMRIPLRVRPNLYLQDPDQGPGPAPFQLLSDQSNDPELDPMANSQMGSLQSTLQDSQLNEHDGFARDGEQVLQGQEQVPQQEQEQDPQQGQEHVLEQDHKQSPEQVQEPVRRRARRRKITMRGQPLLFILFLLTPGFALHVKTCSSPLGMESGEILDSALTASSSYVSNVGPQCARLNKEHLGGGWCPKGQVEATSREYVEVDLGGPRLITGLATQGRHGQGRGVEYLEGYTIEYFRPSLSSWHGYRRWDGNNVFSGNSDTVTVVQHSFTPPLHATNLRVYPHSLHLRTICLRMEVYGCEDDSGLLSYAAPAGSADLGDHVDREYDGVDGEDGLGRLTDGQIGGDFFLIDIGYARGSGWVGWRNSSFPSGYLEITFNFDAIRNISQVNLFANNYHSRNVQVFRTAVVYFSVGGKYFNGDPVVFSQHPDKNNESARNVSIPFNGGRVAKYTKIRLYFQSEWIMLGEVYFTSEIIETNVTDEIHQKVFDDILELTLLNMDYDKSQYEPPTDLMIGSLAIVVLIVVALFLGMLVVHKRKAIGIFKRSNSYLGNDFSMKINMKDLFTNFTPGKDTAVDVLDSSPPSNYEARPPMIIRGELPGLAVGGPPCTLPLPPGNTLTRRKQSYVTATSPRRGKAVVTLAPPPVPRVPPADLTFRTLYGQRACSSKARDGPKYLDVSGGNIRGKAGGTVGWGGRNGSTDLLAISDLEDMHRRFLTPEQINNLTGAPAYVVWNIAPGLRNPRQEEDRVGGSDLPLSYLNLVSHSATGDLSSVDILQHSNFLCRRVSTIQNRGSRRHHSQELLELPYR